MIFYSNHRFCLLCILKNNILSQRLNAICVNYSCVNSFFLQFLSSFHCNFYHQTAANKCYVTAILKNITSANLIYFSIFENISCLISSKSQISRSIICHHCCESSFLISNVCCYEHFKIRKCSHNWDIFKALMWCSILAYTETWMCCNNFYIQIRIGNCLSDLFIGFLCNKHRKSYNYRFKSCSSKSCCSSN